MSYGTEGRRGNPAEEIAPSSSVYEYIVFRGSDVKDISVAEEEKKQVSQPEPPRVPDDPAILGVSNPSFFWSVFVSFTLHTLHCRLLPRKRQLDHMMKYFGCKLTDLFGMRKNRVEISVAFLLIDQSHSSLDLSRLFQLWHLADAVKNRTCRDRVLDLVWSQAPHRAFLLRRRHSSRKVLNRLPQDILPNPSSNKAFILLTDSASARLRRSHLDLASEICLTARLRDGTPLRATDSLQGLANSPRCQLVLPVSSRLSSAPVLPAWRLLLNPLPNCQLVIRFLVSLLAETLLLRLKMLRLHRLRPSRLLRRQRQARLVPLRLPKKVAVSCQPFPLPLRSLLFPSLMSLLPVHRRPHPLRMQLRLLLLLWLPRWPSCRNQAPSENLVRMTPRLRLSLAA